MVIDTHIRPALYAPICSDRERFERRCGEMNYHLMSPAHLDLLKKQYALGDIRHVFLLPEDCSADTGTPVISNEETAALTAADGELFWGFASVDPRKDGAAEELARAFRELGLLGLYLNPAKLRVYPGDPRMTPLYELCRKEGKPIIFHAGLCMESHAIARYAHHMEYEEIADRYPDVNICLTHVGWPWVQETAALLIKYPNLYTNTALMSFDGPYQLYRKVFREDMGQYWVEHNIAGQVMFGSGSPRIRPVRSLRGLESLGFERETMENICWKNALRFLGREG